MYLTVVPTKISSRLAGSDQVDKLEFQSEAISFNPQRGNPFNHEVGNIGQTNAHFVGVELYETSDRFERPPLVSSFYTLEVENPHIHAYRLKLEPGTSTGPVQYDYPGFIIAVSSGKLEIQAGDKKALVHELAPADWQWHDGQMELSVSNKGDTMFEAVIYHLPKRLP